MRGLIDRFRAQTTPEQRRWLARVLAGTGGLMAWRGAQLLWPSTWLALAGMAVFMLTFIAYHRCARITPALQRMTLYGAIPIFLLERPDTEGFIGLAPFARFLPLLAVLAIVVGALLILFRRARSRDDSDSSLVQTPTYTIRTRWRRR